MMRIITAQERLAESNNKITMCIFGPIGIGKTSLLHTLDAATTFAVNMEGGMKSVQSWAGDSVDVRSFEEMRDLACFIGGPNLANRSDQPFSQAHFDHVSRTQFAGWDMSKYRTIFFDSITDLSRLCMQWAKGQPDAFSEKTGKPDTRGAYGLLGREVITLLKHLQHTPGKNIIFVGILDRVVDEFNRETFQPQMDGSKIGRELPGIVDQVVCYSLFDFDEAGNARHSIDKGQHRAFVCQMINGFGLPAKDRSGNLEILEKPHLGDLFEKINAPAKSVADRLTFNEIPTSSAA